MTDGVEKNIGSKPWRYIYSFVKSYLILRFINKFYIKLLHKIPLLPIRLINFI